MTLLFSKSNPYLKYCLDAVVVESDHIHDDEPTYTCMLHDGVLVGSVARRCGRGPGLGTSNCSILPVSRRIHPEGYRQHVLTLVDEHLWSVHLGIKKTNDHTLKHFFGQG